MAVDGRKVNSERSIGELQNIPRNCGPCETEEENIEANGYCVDCREFLCMDCLKHHGRNKASKHHTLLSNEEISSENVFQLPTDTSTEMCTLHKKECIKFFCPEHRTLGCNVCIILSHRACEVEYIPDQCKGISNSPEYRTTVNMLAKEVRKINCFVIKLDVKGDVAESMHDQCLTDLSNFQAQINQRIDEMRKQIKEHADDEMSKTMQDTEKDKNALYEMKCLLGQAESDMNKYQTSNEESQVFISMKKAKFVLHEMEKNEGQISDVSDTIIYKFEPCHRLQNLLAESDCFGKLTSQNLESNEILGPITKGIVILNIPEDMTHDDVMMYFTNGRQSQGEEPVTIHVHAREKYCIVFFKDHSAVPSVCTKTDHTIFGFNVGIHSYNEFLGIPYTFPLEHHDPLIINHLKNAKSKRAKLEEELAKFHAKILWHEYPLQIQSLFKKDGKCRCKCLRFWKRKVKQVFKRFTDAVSIMAISFNKAVWEEVLHSINTAKITNRENISVFLDRKKFKVHVIYDKGYGRTKFNFILGILKRLDS